MERKSGRKGEETVTCKTALVVSGFDPTGGAGLLADISIIRREGIHAAGVPTSLTVQTGKKVKSTRPISRSYLRYALQGIHETFDVWGVKIGMLGTPAIVSEMIRYLRISSLRWVVVDPVFQSSYGTQLITREGLKLFKEIMPLATLVTPNRDELKLLSSIFGIREKKREPLCHALSEISGSSILLTGGHEKERGTDYLFQGGRMTEFPGRTEKRNDFHGTGCAISSLILAHLIMGHTLTKAIKMSKMKLEKGLHSGFRSRDGRWFIKL